MEWVKQLGALTVPLGGSSNSLDYCAGIDFDSLGNIYCAGYTQSSLAAANGGQSDIVLLKFSANGDLLGGRQFELWLPVGSDPAGKDRASAISIDSSDNIYIAGYTDGSLAEANAGNYDAVLLKTNINGDIQWIKQFGTVTVINSGVNTGNDQVTAMRIDSSDNIYIGGTTTGSFIETHAGDKDSFAIKLNPQGEILWSTQLGEHSKPNGGQADQNDNCNSIDIDANGNIFSFGSTMGSLLKQMVVMQI